MSESTCRLSEASPVHLLLPAAEIDKDGNGCVDFQEFLQVSSAAALTEAQM